MAAESYNHTKFTHFLNHFNKLASIYMTKRVEQNPKRTGSVVQEVRSFLEETPSCSLNEKSLSADLTNQNDAVKGRPT